MSKKRKKLIITLSICFGFIFTFVILLATTNFMQVGLIKLMCQDEPSSYPENYSEINDKLNVTTYEYMPNYELDIIEPIDVTPSITVFVFHGGYYIGGGRHNQEPFAKLIAYNGFRVVNVDYPLAPEDIYPSQLEAANKAIAYIDNLLGENQKYVVSGDSAGAHLAAQLTAVVTDDALAKEIGITPAIDSKDLIGLIGNCGYYNPSTIRSTHFFLAEKSVKIVIGENNLNNEKVKQMDVVNYVANFPKTMLLCGDKDPFLPQNELMRTSLKNSGIEVEVYFPTSTDNKLAHEFQCNYDFLESYIAMEKIVAYLNSL